MIAQPPDVYIEQTPHTFIVDIDPSTFDPSTNISALIGETFACTDPNGVRPPNEEVVDMPIGSGLTACFIGTEGNGHLIIHVAKSSADNLSSNLSATDVCKNLGLQQEDVKACVDQLTGWGGDVQLDEEYFPGGTTIVLNVVDGMIEIDMGGWFDKREYTRAQMEDAVRRAKSMTTDQLAQYVATQMALWTPTPTVAPPTLTPYPTTSPIPVESTTPIPGQNGISGTPPTSGDGSTEDSPSPIAPLATLGVLLLIAGGAYVFRNRIRS